MTDEAEFAECVKSLGAEPPSIEGDAITVAVRDKGVVVWVDKGLELGALVGAAAHEATHAALDLLSMIGEDDPGCEMTAWEEGSAFTHRQPTSKSVDSWEKLEEDARQRVCSYFGIDKDTASCDDCPHGSSRTGRTCWQNASLDMIARAKKLAGIEEEAQR